METIIGAILGATITSIVTLYIHSSKKTEKKGLANELLIKLKFLLKNAEAEYYFTKSADENYKVAKLIYSDADAEIIATAFNENPIIYGESDIIRGFRYGSLFIRITSEDICPKKDQDKCRINMQKILKGSSLVVVPSSEHLTKIDGIFCRFKDDTYLCAIAFRDPSNKDKNKGVVFRDGIAEGFFKYYKKISENYECK